MQIAFASRLSRADWTSLVRSWCDVFAGETDEPALRCVPSTRWPIPGGTAGTFAAAKDEEILDWVRQAHAHSRYSTSVCTGSLILGAAGLLDGLQATTHWAAKTLLEQYGAHYTEQRVVAAGKIVTAAGVSSGIDMALWLVGELAGEDLARVAQLAIE